MWYDKFFAPDIRDRTIPSTIFVFGNKIDLAEQR
jgi:hypothetical protein